MRCRHPSWSGSAIEIVWRQVLSNDTAKEHGIEEVCVDAHVVQERWQAEGEVLEHSVVGELEKAASSAAPLFHPTNDSRSAGNDLVPVPPPTKYSVIGAIEEAASSAAPLFHPNE